jgi:hypothetical protein
MSRSNPPFDSHAYGVTVRRVTIDGALLYQGRVRELPDVEVYEESYAAAYELAVDAVQTLYAMHIEEGRPFPAPESEEEFSGRVTLRIPKGLHRRVARAADVQAVSLNQLLVTMIAEALIVYETKADWSFVVPSMAAFPLGSTVVPASTATLGGSYSFFSTVGAETVLPKKPVLKVVKTSDVIAPVLKRKASNV